MVVSGNYPVVLDACVLAPPVVCDLFLRLAETPRLYLPRWSADILAEVRRTQKTRFGFDDHLADYWAAQVTAAFPEAEITEYQPYIEKCTNDPKDRHVLAAAIRCNCGGIVTSNLKDFPKDALEPWKIEALSPSSFLLSLYDMKPYIVGTKMDDMANHRKMTREALLRKLYKSVPGFAVRIAGELEIDLTGTQTAGRSD